MSGTASLVNLGQADIAEQQHVRCHVAHGEAGSGLFTQRAVQHDSLRPEHHPDTEPLGGSRQIPVDGARELGAARHGAHQDGCSQARAEEFGGEVDVVEVGLGECVVGQEVAFQPCRHAVITHVAFATHVDVAAFAGGHSRRSAVMELRRGLDRNSDFVAAQRRNGPWGS